MVFQQYWIILPKIRHITLWILILVLTHSAIYPNDYSFTQYSIRHLTKTQITQTSNYFYDSRTAYTKTGGSNQPSKIYFESEGVQASKNNYENKVDELLGTGEEGAGSIQNQKYRLKYLINPYNYITKDFLQYVKQFNKQYQTPEEYYYRQLVYSQNIQIINQFNQNPDRLFNMGLNEFTDFEQKQFIGQFASLITQTFTSIHFPRRLLATTEYPKDSINWKCYTGTIANQGRCGSCYAFSTADAVAALYTIYNPSISINTRLSVQELISCNDPILSDGCKGGTFENTYDYIIKYGITTQVNYPYRSAFSIVPPPCNEEKKNAKNKRKITSYRKLEPICSTIVQSLRKQPLAVGISSRNLQFYSAGVFQGPHGIVDHAVLLVGYDPLIGFQIKNMWGLTWGELGFGWVDYQRNAGLCSYALEIQVQLPSELKRKQCTT